MTIKHPITNAFKIVPTTGSDKTEASVFPCELPIQTTPIEEAKTETPAEKETEVVTDTTPVVETEFKVSALASQKTAKVGANLSYVITVQGQGGFSQSLTLSVSGIPEKVETSFSSPTVKLSSNQTNQVVELEVSVPDEIEAKTYDFTVSVTPTSGEAKTLPLKLTVEAEAKTTPVVETVSVKAEATSLTADGTSTTALTISLKDIAQQALSGQTVTLSTDIGTVSTAKDNGDGTYTATYTAGTKAGEADLYLEKRSTSWHAQTNRRES